MAKTDIENIVLLALAGAFAVKWYRSKSYRSGFRNANWTPSQVWEIPVD